MLQSYFFFQKHYNNLAKTFKESVVFKNNQIFQYKTIIILILYSKQQVIFNYTIKLSLIPLPYPSRIKTNLGFQLILYHYFRTRQTKSYKPYSLNNSTNLRSDGLGAFALIIFPLVSRKINLGILLI